MIRGLALALGVAGLAACSSGGDGDVSVAAGRDTGPAEEVPAGSGLASEPEDTTTTAAPPTTIAPAAPTAPLTTGTTGPPPTATTARPAVTTTTAPRPAAKVTPVGWSEPNLAGQRYFHVLVSGEGCAGAENGWGFNVSDPSGQPFSGDGGQATPDGHWEMEFSFYSVHVPGRYTFQASCNAVSTSSAIFSYDPVYYDWPGSQ